MTGATSASSPAWGVTASALPRYQARWHRLTADGVPLCQVETQRRRRRIVRTAAAPDTRDETCVACDWKHLAAHLEQRATAKPVTVCPRCKRDSHTDVLCDACEEAEAVLFLANNSLTDSRGVQLGDDPRR